MIAISGDWRQHALPRLATGFAAYAAAHETELQLIESRTGFDSLEAEWNALFERAADSHQVFQSFAWNCHWCNHFLDGATRLAVVVAREHGRLVMVWPLVAERHLGLLQIKWMGDPVSQYGDVLIEKRADRRRLLNLGWRYIREHLRGDVVRLRKVRADSAVAPLLSELGAFVSNHAEAPYLDLASAPDAATYQERYSAKARKNRRRQRRRLEERGAMGFEQLPPGKAAGDIAALAISMKRAWLKERGILSAAIEDNRLRSFFRDVAASPLQPTGCQVSVLRSAGEAAAVQIGLASKGRLAMHVIVYNLKLEKSAPGALAIEHCIEQAYRDGIACFDLLAPGDAYKMEWADGVVAVADHAVPMSQAGKVYIRLYLALLRNGLKRAVTQSPPWARRLLHRLYTLRECG